MTLQHKRGGTSGASTFPGCDVAKGGYPDRETGSRSSAAFGAEVAEDPGRFRNTRERPPPWRPCSSRPGCGNPCRSNLDPQVWWPTLTRRELAFDEGAHPRSTRVGTQIFDPLTLNSAPQSTPEHTSDSAAYPHPPIECYPSPVVPSRRIQYRPAHPPRP